MASGKRLLFIFSIKIFKDYCDPQRNVVDIKSASKLVKYYLSPLNWRPNALKPVKDLQVPLNSAAVGKAVQRKTETLGASETVLPRNAEIVGLLIRIELDIIMEIELNFFPTYI